MRHLNAQNRTALRSILWFLGDASSFGAHYYLRIENAEGNVLIAVYLYACVRACYSHKSKSIKPNRMKFGGMIGCYPGTI